MRKTPSLRLEGQEQPMKRNSSGLRPNTTKAQDRKNFLFDMENSLSNRGALSPSNGRNLNLLKSISTDTLAKEDGKSQYKLDPTKQSSKRNGKIAAYAANTNQGLFRDYNEDRVSIILNIVKPGDVAAQQWPRASFFGVYDGHGGTNCADFLRDNLHQFVIRQPTFPSNVKEAIHQGFKAAENAFLAKAREGSEIDRSGSCAIVVMVVGDYCYVANVGDSRAVLSANSGTRCIDLSRDHKPIDDNEFERINRSGGKVYQTHIQNQRNENGEVQTIIGPHRVFPGRLSVSRTIGDVEAKDTELGGNPNVVIATPEIKCFKISPDHDFIILGSDGIFDKMSSREVINCSWQVTKKSVKDLHCLCTSGVENIIRNSFVRKSMDNVTVLMIAFDRFFDLNFGPESLLRADKENVNVLNLTRNTELLQKFKKITMKNESDKENLNSNENTSSSRRLRRGYFN